MNLPQIARYLVLLASAILTYFGLGTLLNLGSHPEMIGWYAAYALFAFIQAALLLFCYFRLKQRGKKIFWLAIILLGANVILTIFDQVGVIDMIYMLINFVALVTLYLSRKDFLPE
jgi:lysylphosphatidylglycerol synthetase-like protein (DUF2156 family)